MYNSTREFVETNEIRKRMLLIIPLYARKVYVLLLIT